MFHGLRIPIIRNGAAKLMPINSISKYIAKPNAPSVDIIADMIPIKPSHGFDLTESPIILVIMLIEMR